MKNIKIYIIGLFIFITGVYIGNKWLAKPGNIETNQENHISGEEKNQRWTCSMHPQIDLPNPGQCPICGMDLIPKKDHEEKIPQDAIKLSPSDMALGQIETMKIGESGNIPQGGLVLNGEVKPDEKKSFVQVAHFGGRIEKLYVNSEGEYVKKGQTIASIYSPELVSAQNELIQALYVKEEQPELYASVRNKLKYWKLTEQQIKQIENTKKVIPYFSVYSDYNGYVNKIFVEEGNHVAEGGALYSLSDLSNVWIWLDIYEKDLDKISVGQPVILHFNAFPNKKIKTKINFIDSKVDPVSGIVKARVDLKNFNSKLKPGMLVSAIVENNTSISTEKPVMIPKTAVIWTGKKSIVYVKLQDGVFQMREVVLGNASGEWIEIVSGLSPGEEIVTKGVFTIDATAQLEGKPSMLVKEPEPDRNAKKGEMKCGAGKCGSGM